jgi:DNA mismatch repair protein MutS
MCGVPYHAAHSYIARLLKLGKKVAICEQISEPGNGLVDRKVLEVVTPGTTVDEDFLDKGSSNYLACFSSVKGTSGAGQMFSFAYIDISTGDFYASSFNEEEALPSLRAELERLQIREIIIQESLLDDKRIASSLGDRSSLVINRWGDWLFDRERSLKRMKRQFGSIKGFGLDETSAEILSAGALLDYLDETSGGLIPHVRSIKVYRDSEFVGLDEESQRNLELTRNLQDGDVRFSLLECLDETRTAMGSRLLKRRLLHPLRDRRVIDVRLNAVETFYRDQRLLGQIREIFGKTPDLERLRSRLAMDKAHAKDMLSIKNALLSFEAAEEQIAARDFSFENTAAVLDRAGFERLLELKDLLSRGICDDPSILLTEGNLIRQGYNAELDKLRSLQDNGRMMLEAYLEEEKEATGISNLKIRYNRLIGYFFEVTNAQLTKVPRHFIKRQGTVNAERYSTERLAGMEFDINNASEKIVSLEKELFLELREKGKGVLTELSAAGERIAELDVAQSLARAATLHFWSRPVLDEELRLDIAEARHPVVEAHLPSGEFIPNDVQLDGDGISFALITGPNMAGKSTYLRQTALIVIMAQMGSFVPAKEARIGIVDRIYCRVGASDNLARGESTFLVEMNETAYIINTASKQSLVIMDEVGRGTGINDGFAIAWAVSEELLDSIQCRTLFATHYHDLSSLSHPKLVNRSMEVLEDDGKLVFLRKIKEGSSSESYGLNVARLAGLSNKVIERADRIMEKLDENNKKLSVASDLPPQKSLTDKQTDKTEKYGQLIREIEEINIETLTPLDALNQIHIWKQMLQGKAVKPHSRKSAKPDSPSLFG